MPPSKHITPPSPLAPPHSPLAPTRPTRPSPLLTRPTPLFTRRSLSMLLPRPHSFLANGAIFAAGLLFAWLEGFHSDRAIGLPLWLFVLLWFIVQELLVQQAKYMWNDIRDHERDQHVPANKVRPLARQPLTKLAPTIMAGRWLAGVAIAIWLSPVLLALVLIITGLQVVYELWAKPHAGERPLLPLYVIGAGMVMKGIGGALAMGGPVGEQRLWLYGLVLFATGIVVGSSFWRTEAVYFSKMKLVRPRGQSAYYAASGLLWLKAGTAVTIAGCTILIFDGYTNFLTQTALPAALVITLIFTAGVLCCQLSFWLLAGSKRIFLLLAALFVAACAVYLLLQVESLIPLPKGALIAVLLLLVLLIDHRLNYSADYRQTNLIYLAENWPRWKRLARKRPSHVRRLAHWWQLLQLALALNSPKKIPWPSARRGADRPPDAVSAP